MSMNIDYTDPQRPKSPATDRSFYQKKPRGITFHEFVDLIKFIWEKGHPDIEFVPMKSLGIADIEKAYVIYMVESRVPAKDWPKPRLREVIHDTDSGKDIQVSSQLFNNIISFSAVHKDPRVAEEIIEAFEDFMQEHMPIFHENGISNLFYDRRYQDSKDSRIGDDMAVRKVSYLLILEKIYLMSFDRIESVMLDVRTFMHQYYTVQKATPDWSANVIDTYASDS